MQELRTVRLGTHLTTALGLQLEDGISCLLVVDEVRKLEPLELQKMSDMIRPAGETSLKRTLDLSAPHQTQETFFSRFMSQLLCHCCA